MSKLRDDLRAYYQTAGLRPSKEEWPPNQPTSIVNVALIHYNNTRMQQELIDISKRFKEGASAVDKLSSSHSRVTKDISKIFAADPIDSTVASTSPRKPPKRILIEGAPGIGKTVLAKEIALRWANDELLKDFILVFLLYLRDPKLHTISSVKELLMYTSENVAQDVENYLLECKEENVAFVLDGFDEFPGSLQKDSFITSIIEGENSIGKIFCRFTVVVTSRPTDTLFLHRVVHRRIEILGFAKEGRDKYISLSLCDEPEKKEDLVRYLKNHPIINGLCFIPLHLAILLFLFQVDSLPETLTEMNEFFVVHTIYRYLSKVRSPDKSKVNNPRVTDLPDDIQRFIEKLSKLAYEGLQNSQLVFSYDEIKKVCPEIDSIPGAINGFGLLQAVQHYIRQGFGETISFNFLHFSMQEYLAAFYVSNLPVDQSSLLMKETFWDGRFSFMWMMYAGIVGIKSSAFISFLYENALHHGTEVDDQGGLTLAHDVQNDKRKCLHLFHCYIEAKCNEIPEAVSFIFSGGNIQLTGITLLPHHISSLVFFMFASKQQWRTLDLHNCNLRGIGMNTLLEHVIKSEGNMSTLQYVDLSGNLSSPWGVYCVIIRHCCVNSLTLCGDNWMEEHVKEIAEHVKEIADSLEANKRLNSLTIHNVGRIGVESIRKVLINNTTLNDINLSWKKLWIKDDDNVLLCTQVLISNEVMSSARVVNVTILYDEHHEYSPKEIDLSSTRSINNDVVAVLIAFGLCDNITVHTLNVSSCNISDDGVIAIVDCLKTKCSLQELDLSHNTMTIRGELV